MYGWGEKHHPQIILRVLCALGLKGQCPRHAPKLAALKVARQRQRRGQGRRALVALGVEEEEACWRSLSFHGFDSGAKGSPDYGIK